MYQSRLRQTIAAARGVLPVLRHFPGGHAGARHGGGSRCAGRDAAAGTAAVAAHAARSCRHRAWHAGRTRRAAAAAAGQAPRRKPESRKPRAEKTGRESRPGYTPPREIEGRGENPGAPDVIPLKSQKLATFLRFQ